MRRNDSTRSEARPPRGKARKDGRQPALVVTIAKRLERRPSSRKQGRAGGR